MFVLPQRWRVRSSIGTKSRPLGVGQRYNWWRPCSATDLSLGRPVRLRDRTKGCVAGIVTGGLIDYEDPSPARYGLGPPGWPRTVRCGVAAHAGAESALGGPGGRATMGISRSDLPLRDHRALGVRAFAR